MLRKKISKRDTNTALLDKVNKCTAFRGAYKTTGFCCFKNCF